LEIYLTKITELEIKATAIQYTSLRILSSLGKGDSPGPESSMMKTLVTDLEQEISEVTLDVIGYYGIPFQDTTYGSNEPPIGDEDYRPIAGKYQNLRATTIYGGSNEIQRNIMAKAVLGL
jgi:alkylation response protein AidB-like acyl-CoA dehydrogenase